MSSVYSTAFQQIVETMPQSKEVEDFLKSIGPFYEEVEDETSKPHTNPTPDKASVHTEGDSTVAADVKESSSDSEDEIFSDPIATSESQSVRSDIVCVPLLLTVLWNIINQMYSINVLCLYTCENSCFAAD